MHHLFKQTGLYLTLLFALSGANIIAVDAALSADKHILPAVRVGEIDVSGLTIDEAQNALKDSIPVNQTSLLIKFEDMQWRVEAKDIELAIDEQGTAQAAYSYPRQGHLLSRFMALHTIHDVKAVMILNEEKLGFLVKNLTKEINISSKPASIRLNSDNVLVINPGTKGRELDENSLQVVKNALFNSQAVVDLAVHDVVPTITEADLQHMNGVLAEYQTEYNTAEAARSQNILLAANSLNGTLLRPGEILSFNDIVGQRTEQRGYRKAPAYINEEQLVDDWGGGICQVSSTLYNAALLADLAVVERSAHFRPAGYVPIGLDATVDFASNLDLKVKNTSPDSVYILIETKPNQLIVKVLGKVIAGKPQVQVSTISLTAVEPKEVIIQDASLDLGMKKITQVGQKGFYVSTARIRSANGKELSRELLAEDTYNPVDNIVHVGIKTNVKTK